MHLKRYFDKEIWSEIELKSPFKEKFRLFVSNHGKIKKLNLQTNEESLVSQSTTEGYPSFNITVHTPHSPKNQAYVDETRAQIEGLKQEVRDLRSLLKQCKDKKEEFLSILKQLEAKKEELEIVWSKYQQKFRKLEAKRKKTFSGLTHRFVATAFLEKESPEHNLVAHLDFDKLNNHHSNLKWMTREENVAHQKNSPFVIKAKAVAVYPGRITRAKLTVKEVMILKKRMNENVPLSKLAKRYNVTETQLLRIKRGINWANVPAAL